MKKQLNYKNLKKQPAFKFAILIAVPIFILLSSITSYKLFLEGHKYSEISIAPGKGITLEIPPGANTSMIADILEKKGVIKQPALFKFMSRINGYDGRYISGTHVVSNELSYEDIMVVLSGMPQNNNARVTIPEGYTFSQIADVFAKKDMIDRDKFDKAANTEVFDYRFLKDIPTRKTRLEGYLFPDTYEFRENADETEIIKNMLGRFNEIFKPEYYDKAKELNMTPDKIVILASIIEREARDDGERKTIASVFYNRLNSKDKPMRRLQSCATVQYILLNKNGVYKEKIMEKDTMIKDPYNTYQNEGLPPGPICSPGKASLEAALYPEKTDYLYFVAKGDGTHHFSKTYKEHQVAMKKYGVN